MLGDAIVISKATRADEDGYSPFDGHTENGTTLENLLWMRGITDVYVGGLATDYCVKAAAMDAAKKGFRVFLLADACRAVDAHPGDGERAIREMRDAGVRAIAVSSLP